MCAIDRRSIAKYNMGKILSNLQIELHYVTHGHDNLYDGFTNVWQFLVIAIQIHSGREEKKTCVNRNNTVTERYSVFNTNLCGW